MSQARGRAHMHAHTTRARSFRVRYTAPILSFSRSPFIRATYALSLQLDVFFRARVFLSLSRDGWRSVPLELPASFHAPLLLAVSWPTFDPDGLTSARDSHLAWATEQKSRLSAYRYLCPFAGTHTGSMNTNTNITSKGERRAESKTRDGESVIKMRDYDDARCRTHIRWTRARARGHEIYYIRKRSWDDVRQKPVGVCKFRLIIRTAQGGFLFGAWLALPPFHGFIRAKTPFYTVPRRDEREREPSQKNRLVPWTWQ